MKLNRKHIKIIQLLLNNHTSIERLSFLVEVSERTLLNYVKQINDYFDNRIAITKIQQNLTIYIENEHQFLNQLDEVIELTENAHSEHDNKMEIIFFQILKNKICTIDDIAEYTFMSKTSVSNLLKDMKAELEVYDVSIIGKPNVGLYISGREYDIRKLIIEKFSNKYLSIEIDLQLREQLLELKKSLKLDEQTYQRLVVAIQVTIDRVDEKAFMDSDLAIDNNVFVSNDYKAIDFVKRYLTENYENLEINKELILVVIQLMGRRATILDELISSSEAALIDDIIAHTIDDVIKYFGIEIDDGLFTKDIRLHIKYLINRIIFDIRLHNESAIEMKKRFPFAFELSKVLGENITKALNLKVSEEELGYLTIYFSIYLEKLEQEVKDISKVAILTDYGLSVYKLLKNNVIKLFGQQVEITMIEKADFNEEDLDNYEIVISTVKENRLFNRIIYIEDAFDEQVLKLKVEQFLIYKDLNRKNIFNKSVIADCMTENDLYYLDNKYTYQEMIAMMADELYEQDKVDKDFKKCIINRERSKSTINKKLGFPHASHKKSSICIKIILLENGCADYPDLKIIVLIATPEETINEALLIRIYEEVLALSTNTFLISKFSHNTNFYEFKTLLNQEMKG